MKAVVLVLALACMACATDLYKNSDLILTDEFVNKINSAQKLWVASTEQGRQFSKESFTFGHAKQLMGVRGRSAGLLPRMVRNITSIPASFDSSMNWPQCKTIMQIRDQSACGSCWAFGAAEAMSDRYCTILGTEDTKYEDVEISAGDLLACCDSCGNGCEGGYLDMAWQYWVSNGLPTRQCMPYPFPMCEHHIPPNHYPPCPHDIYPNPECNTTCSDGSQPTYYTGKSAYAVSGETQMQMEIMQNGPIEVAFTVYSDFLAYKSGVYVHTNGQVLGGHAVKMIGWGSTQGGTNYWIINNSWNSDWGMKGQFWILRGVDECGIESEGYAGVPNTF